MAPTAPLSDDVRAFIAAPLRFATLATLDDDGAPRQAVIWYRLGDDGRLAINSADGRRWPANLRRDPRCSLVIAEPANAYAFVALIGRVTETIDDQAVAQGDIADLARRYHPDEPARAASAIAQFQAQHRVTFRVEILAVHDHRVD